MIKLILFDLDGVLIDAKQIHYDALNIALGSKYQISLEEHRNIYDGFKTRQKLQMLSDKKGLEMHLWDDIFDKKQEITREKMRDLKPQSHIVELFQKLQKDYMIGVCSNSIRRTVLTALAKSDLLEYCSIILSNEDVKNSKPHPEMYWKAMSSMNCLPKETIIIEDSPPGLAAAKQSGAQYIRVSDPSETNINHILPKVRNNKMHDKHIPEWQDEKLNVLIPMAGAGSRFVEAGYTFPKPLIQVNDKPMIQLVVENLSIKANYIFVVQKEHREKYNLDTLLNLVAPNCKIVEVDEVTEGAACTALLAREFIDNDQPLFFANSDQYVEWNSAEFMYNMQETQADGGILTFKATHPKWSFAKVDDNGFVTEVAEKNPISDKATVGFYYWKKGSDFVKYADSMIEKEVRVNGEFYVCPVFNEAIADNKHVRTHEANAMWGLGTPEDLNQYLQDK